MGEAGGKERLKLITKSSLKKRGWTESIIDAFFPEPSKVVPNPRYRSAPPMCLYEEARVIELEATEAFRAARARAANRITASKASAQRRKEQTEAWVKGLPEPKIPIHPPGRLTRATPSRARFWRPSAPRIRIFRRRPSGRLRSGRRTVGRSTRCGAGGEAARRVTDAMEDMDLERYAWRLGRMMFPLVPKATKGTSPISELPPGPILGA